MIQGSVNDNFVLPATKACERENRRPYELKKKEREREELKRQRRERREPERRRKLIQRR